MADDEESTPPAIGSAPLAGGFGHIKSQFTHNFTGIGRNILGDRSWLSHANDPATLNLLSAATQVEALQTDMSAYVDTLRPDQSPRKTAKNTKITAERMHELVALVDAELQVSREVRDNAKAATDAAERSGRHSLVISYASVGIAVASLAVAIVTLLVTGQPPAPTP